MLYEIDQRIEMLMEEYICGECKVGREDKTGLDPRAFPGIFWFNENAIIIRARSRRVLDYYGGFEYIDSDYVTQYGDYVVYSADADRVREVIDNMLEETEDA